MNAHIELAVEELVAGGLTTDEARREARRLFGNPRVKLEEIDSMSALAIADVMGRDLRHSIRALRASPSFTITALLIFALGIGAATAIFSVVDAVVIHALPFDEPGRLVAVTPRYHGIPLPASAINLLDWRSQQDVFDGIAATRSQSVTIGRDNISAPEIVPALAVTANLFSVLHAIPAAGRAIRSEEELTGADRVAVISHRLWQRRFGGAADTVGRMLTVDGVEREIIGVMPPGFEYPVGELRATDVWLPYVMPPSELRRGSNWSVSLRLVARLRDGRTLLQAQEQMREITAGLAGTPGWRPETEVVIEDLQSSITGRVRPWMFMLLAAVACVLLVAWVNVANLMLVRAITRARELGIRIALGATRGDLVRYLLTESLLLSVAGALLGILAAWWGVVILKAAMPPYVPRVANIAIDFRVLAVAAVMSLITGVVCSVAAVLHVSRRALVPCLTIRARAANADKGHRWLRSTLVVSQLGLAVVLLVGAGLFASSFARVMGVDLGFDPRNVLVVPVRPMINSLNPKDRARAVELTRGRLLALVDAVANAPGIAVASATGGAVGLPFGGSFSADLIQGDGLPVEIRTAQITPGYFSALGVAILEGRPFRNDDRMGAPRVAILSESAARALFPVGSAIGRLIDAGEPLRVVGVVRDIRNAGPELETSPAMFTALAQGTPTSATLVVRVSQRASTVAPAIMSAIWSEFPDVGLPEPYTLEQSFDRLVAQRRLNMLLVGLFGLLGLTIASVGVYAAMAHLVVQRTREIGIRVALGAAPARVRRSVLRRAAGHVFAGLAIGVTTAWLLAGLVEAFLFRVRAHDLAVYVTAICVLAFAALIAAWIPARRASRVDPIIAIHAD